MRGPVDQVVEHLFRHQHGQLVATLGRVLGLDHLSLAEDIVQETLVRALRHWPYHGVPENPAGWMFRVARNLAIDHLRQDTRLRGRLDDLGREMDRRQRALEQPGTASEFDDDHLHMIFACCDPALSVESQIALTLKTVCGFGVPEIARAFLSTEAAVSQRIVRAKARLRAPGAWTAGPGRNEVPGRMEAVLRVLYLMFNEGYAAHRGHSLVREDVCEEALRLAGMLVRHPPGDSPQVHALLALMYLEAARFEARTRLDGSLIVLAEQDRARWNRQLIERGVQHLSKARQGTVLTEYHLEAGVAACHTVAPSFEETDWQSILFYYDELALLRPSPIVGLNRAVAVAMLDGPAAGLRELSSLSEDGSLRDYHHFHATAGEFHARLGDWARARACFREALRLAESLPERRFLEMRLERGS